MLKEEFYKVLKNRLPKSDFILNYYTASREPCSITCNKCGKTIERSRADSFLQRARDGFKDVCKYCDEDSETNKMKKETIDKIIHANENIECLNLDFKNIRTPVKWSCKKCGMTFDRTPGSFLKNSKCPYCEGKHYKMTIDIIKNLCKQIWGEEYAILSEDYQSKNTYESEKILVRHNACGFCWSVNAFGFLYDKKGCPRCVASKGEKTIRKFLQEHNYDFDEQVQVFYEGHLFRYDFVVKLEHRKVFIEYNGDQHYQPVKIWGGQNGYEKRIAYDKMKQDYCDENNYELIILRKDDLSLLFDKLAQRLKDEAI